MIGSSVTRLTGSKGWRYVREEGENLLFPPEHTTAEAAQAALEAVIHQRPAAFGQSQTRWTLSGLKQACPWLRVNTLAGMHQVLERINIHWKRGRGHLHSPDPDYVPKLSDVWRWIREVQDDFDQQVLLFGDEFGFYRQPTLANDYERAGETQPLAELGHRTNACWRIAGALNTWTGQVTYVGHAHFTIKLLVDFFAQITNTYPCATTIYLVVDNWPVHFHPDVLAALQPQTFPWPLHRPGNWPTEPSKQARFLNLPIQLVQLPTYAPWANPIEKLWLLLKKNVLHLHRFEDDWAGLKQRVDTELEQFTQPSPDLLRFVGLSDPLRLYHSLFDG
jgi:hypothetical protein